MVSAYPQLRTIVGAVALAVGLAGSWNTLPTVQGIDTGKTWTFRIASVEARPAARTARRVDRRTTRRTVAATTAYYDTLPAGCVVRGRYWYCGGAYYEQVNHDGRDVYMVVTP